MVIKLSFGISPFEKTKCIDLPGTATSEPRIDPAELAREKARYEAETKAFQEMMNYNADVAYGIKPEGEE